MLFCCYSECFDEAGLRNMWITLPYKAVLITFNGFLAFQLCSNNMFKAFLNQIFQRIARPFSFKFSPVYSCHGECLILLVLICPLLCSNKSFFLKKNKRCNTDFLVVFANAINYFHLLHANILLYIVFAFTKISFHDSCRVCLAAFQKILIFCFA
jgi:hypothetical protein